MNEPSNFKLTYKHATTYKTETDYYEQMDDAVRSYRSKDRLGLDPILWVSGWSMVSIPAETNKA